MTTCSNCHLSRPTNRYKAAMRQVFTSLCDPCHASLSALGMVWVPERRAVDLTPIRERRRPEWLSRLAAKDLTGRIVA